MDNIKNDIKGRAKLWIILEICASVYGEGLSKPILMPNGSSENLSGVTLGKTFLTNIFDVVPKEGSIDLVSSEDFEKVEKSIQDNLMGNRIPESDFSREDKFGSQDNNGVKDVIDSYFINKKDFIIDPLGTNFEYIKGIVSEYDIPDDITDLLILKTLM